jgi:rRNA maturation protein Rpf1
LILISTSRRPTSRIRRFSHDLNRLIAKSIYINRGKLNMIGIIERARTIDADRVILVERWKGEVGRLRFYYVSLNAFTATPPLLIIRSVKTQYELGQKTRIEPNIGLVIPKLASLNSNEEKLLQFLSHFLQIPLYIEKTVKTMCSTALSLNSLPNGDLKLIVTSPPLCNEVGPRITIRKVVW